MADKWTLVRVTLPNPLTAGNRLELIVTDLTGNTVLSAGRTITKDDPPVISVLVPNRTSTVTVTEHDAETGERVQRSSVRRTS